MCGGMGVQHSLESVALIGGRGIEEIVFLIKQTCVFHLTSYAVCHGSKHPPCLTLPHPAPPHLTPPHLTPPHLTSPHPTPPHSTLSLRLDAAFHSAAALLGGQGAEEGGAPGCGGGRGNEDSTTGTVDVGSAAAGGVGDGGSDKGGGSNDGIRPVSSIAEALSHRGSQVHSLAGVQSNSRRCTESCRT